MAAPREAKIAYGEWLSRTPAERKRLGLPPSKAGMARHLGVNAKTLQRWQGDPDVEAAYSAHLADRIVSAEPGVAAPAAPEPEDDSEPQSWEDIKRKLLRGATESEDGLKLYMSYIGKHELERERSAQEKGFRDVSDAELVGLVLELVGVDAVREWLEAQS